MTEINFGGTYRIAISQPGINSAKKAKLKSLIESYPNALIGTSKGGHARISLSNSDDSSFVQKLKAIGYKIFQRFDAEDVDKKSLDRYIKGQLDNREYKQVGKQKNALAREVKELRSLEKHGNGKHISKLKKGKPVELEDISKTSNIQNTKRTEINANSNSGRTESSSAPTLAYHPSLIHKKVAPTSPEKRLEIMQSEDYLRISKQYGVEAANAIFFGV